MPGDIQALPDSTFTNAANQHRCPTRKPFHRDYACYQHPRVTGTPALPTRVGLGPDRPNALPRFARSGCPDRIHHLAIQSTHAANWMGNGGAALTAWNAAPATARIAPHQTGPVRSRNRRAARRAERAAIHLPQGTAPRCGGPRRNPVPDHGPTGPRRLLPS